MFRFFTLALFVFIFGLLSCEHRHIYPQSLLVADSLADVRPDSALAYLRLLEDSVSIMSRPDSMYYALLKIKAADKAYIVCDTTNGILDVMRYYRGPGDHRLLPMAYYYTASTYRDMNRFVDAIDYFYAAIGAAKKYGDCRRILPLSHSRIADLYSLHRMYGAAKDEIKMALRYDSLAGFNQGLIYEYMNLGKYYFCLGKKDSAMNYYSMSLALAKKEGDGKLQAMASSQLANAYIKLGQYSKAGPLISFALNYDDSLDRSSLYSIASNFYEAIGRKNEALKCYQLLVHVGNIYGRQVAYDKLSRYYLYMSSKDSASYYSALSEILTDSIKNIKKFETIANKNFDYKLGRSHANVQHSLMLYCGIFVILFFVVICTYVARHSRRDETKNSVWIGKDVNTSVSQEEKFVEACGDNINDDAFKSLDNLTVTEYKLCKDTDLACLPIVIKIKSRLGDKSIDWVRSPWRMTAEDWNMLDCGVNKVCNGFKDVLMGQRSLSEKEYRVCLLIKVGVNPAGIAHLLFCTYQSVSNIRVRLYEKYFQGHGSPSAWDDYIRSL